MHVSFILIASTKIPGSHQTGDMRDSSVPDERASWHIYYLVLRNSSEQNNRCVRTFLHFPNDTSI